MDVAADAAGRGMTNYSAENLARDRWRIAALKFELKIIQLAFKVFNPLQPRVPAGSSEGGRWAGDNPLVQPAAERQRDRLSGEELAKDPYLNRHILDRHVGQTDEQMIARVAETQERLFFGIIEPPLQIIRSGTFDTVESARGFISEAIERNREEISRIADGSQQDGFIQTRFGYPTGREAVSIPRGSPIRIRTTYGVGMFVVHDPSTERGFRITTAYPENAGLDE